MSDSAGIPPTLVTRANLDALTGTAAAASRRRANVNLHPDPADAIQRLFNAMEPDTYVRPHRHARDDGWELMLCLRGAFAILLFGDGGQVARRVELDSRDGDVAVEIPAWTWHAVVSHRAGTVMFEVKPGPYQALSDKDFARWAPPEGDPAAEEFRRWYATAGPGERPPPWAPGP